jgi:hypothetical protein
VTRAAGRLAADQVEQQYGLWQAADEEIEAMAAPASRLAYRRLPEEARGSSDLFDVLDLALATAGYVLRNLQLRTQLRTARQLHEAAAAQPEPAP